MPTRADSDSDSAASGCGADACPPCPCPGHNPLGSPSSSRSPSRLGPLSNMLCASKLALSPSMPVTLLGGSSAGAPRVGSGQRMRGGVWLCGAVAAASCKPWAVIPPPPPPPFPPPLPPPPAPTLRALACAATMFPLRAGGSTPRSLGPSEARSRTTESLSPSVGSRTLDSGLLRSVLIETAGSRSGPARCESKHPN
eukprot:1079252-Rhodomonas_salina.3